jgi:ferredoxin
VKVEIEQSICIACGLCREVCPEDAVHPKLHNIHHWFEVIPDECTGCGDCLSYCPAPGALVQYEPQAA